MSIHSAEQLVLDFLPQTPVVLEISPTQLTSDAGLLPMRLFDERIGLTEQFAAALTDRRRDPEHTFLEMVRVRIFGLLADYEDQNDHDALRFDPVFKLVAGRLPQDAPLASQPTHSRFENAIDIASLYRLRDVLIDQFLDSFDSPPSRLTFDIDTYDDPAHGAQQLVLFDAHNNQYQYQPRIISCAENDHVVMLCLLYGSAFAGLGAEDDIRYLIQRVRAKWPDVVIHLRGDSAFACPAMYDMCEALRIDFSFGFGTNPLLKRNTQDLEDQALELYEATGQPQRLFDGFEYRARSWPHSRWMIVKAEANAQGTNRRFMVTNRPGGRVLPGPCYDDYTDRGESENRNKELKLGMHGERLSDHRYLANLFRLYLHAAALNLLVRLRRVVADPPPDPGGPLPQEAREGRERRRGFNRRRERDPLGEGHPATWRTRLIKVAAEVIQSSRRVLVRLSASWPFHHHLRHVSECVNRFVAGFT
jgi:hypothetical protein